MRRPLFAAVIVVILGSRISAADCPEGFRYIGTLSGISSSGKDLNESAWISLPENATLDETYQQTAFQSSSTNTHDHSNVRADIPKGIHIDARGSHEMGSGWAVSDPQLRTVITSGQSRYFFGMRLFSTAGQPEPSLDFGGSEVHVEVCYKPKT